MRLHKFNIINMVLMLSIPYIHASELNIAVASNFATTAKQLAQIYHQTTGNNVVISSASTGTLYNQIKNGAPFAVLLSADTTTTAKLIADNLVIESSNYTYATGRVVLWSKQANYVDNNGSILKTQSYNHLAVANPKLAPYGAAGYQVINYFKLAEQLKTKIVTGDNINSTYQLIASGNAELGFVALAQIMRNGKITSGSAWVVPDNIATPIKQTAVVLTSAKNNPIAYDFMNFLKSSQAQQIIHSYGYQ